MHLLPMPLSDTNAAYMAGIIDGEGCIYVNRRKASGRRLTPGYGVKVCISITNRSIVDWFIENVRLTSVYGFQPNGNRQYKWVCTWNNSAAESLLLAVMPYLLIKKEHAELALTLLKDLRMSVIRGGVGRSVTPETVIAREQIKKAIANLNARGKRLKFI